MAAGLSMHKSNFEKLNQSLNDKCQLVEEDFVEKLYIDVPLPIHCITEDLIDMLNLLEPFGKGNEKPLFAWQHLRILSMKRIGRENNMLKLCVSDDFASVDALLFDDADEFLLYLESEFGKNEVLNAFSGRNNSIDIGLVYYPGINEFRGERTIQITISDYCHIK